MKHVLLIILGLCLSVGLYAQNQSNITITGRVFDKTTQETIEAASIRILNARDSSYVNGTATDKNGNFKITLKNAPYIVNASFLGMGTKYINVDSPRNARIGDIYLEEDGVLLHEAIVTAKAIEVLVKGDTVEYNADSYKVQESAVLEDLIKKIPGAEIDANGKITINGKDISKILVDGKEFFSDDPKVASKNLPAKMVEKLQVLDKKSDMAQLTGFDDGEEETVLNLTFKPGMKEGLFGQFQGGYGTKDRYEGNGMINYMRNNTQISVLGGLNNTNNAGFTDFASGMGGGGPRGISFGSNNGVATTNNLGINIASELSEKFKINGSVNFGSIDNDVTNESEKIYDSGQLLSRQTSNSKSNSKSQNIGANFRMEWAPDTLTKIIFRPNVRYNKNEISSRSGGYRYYSEGFPNKEFEGIDFASDTSTYSSNSDGLNLNGSIIASRKLSNKGRSITLRLSGGLNNNDADVYNYSASNFNFREALNKPDSIGTITNQYNKQKNKSYNWRTTVSYVEPLGRNNFLELEYSIRKNNSRTDKDVFAYDEIEHSYLQPVDSVTRYLTNDFLTQNATLSFQSVRSKFNYTIGLGVEPASSRTNIIIPNEEQKIMPRLDVVNIVPKFRFNYRWSKSQTLRIDYRGSTNQPSTEQLYDGDYSNTATSIVRGNPNLDPSFTNNISVRYQSFNAEKAAMFMIFGRFQNTLNDITRISTWEGSRDLTTYKNVNGNMSANLRMVFNRPLRNRNFSINGMTYGGYNRTNSFISQKGTNTLAKNTANLITVHENLGLRFTSDMFDFTLRGNVKFERLINSVSDNNRSIFDYGGYADFSIHLPYNFHIESDLNYSANSGYEGNYKKNEWLWNAAISMDFLKAKNATFRVKAYDLLRERSNISWSSGSNYTEYSRTNTINSYVMFSLVYRFQSFKGGVKQGDMQRGMGPGRGPGGHGGPGRPR